MRIRVNRSCDCVKFKYGQLRDSLENDLIFAFLSLRNQNDNTHKIIFVLVLTTIQVDKISNSNDDAEWMNDSELTS